MHFTEDEKFKLKCDIKKETDALTASTTVTAFNYESAVETCSDLPRFLTDQPSTVRRVRSEGYYYIFDGRDWHRMAVIPDPNKIPDANDIRTPFDVEPRTSDWFLTELQKL